MDIQAKQVCMAFALLSLVAPTGAHARQGAEGLNSGSWDGSVVVKTVDSRRVVVAIDTSNEGRPADGLIDRVFLFTASDGLQLPAVMFSGRGHLEYSGNSLRIMPTGGALALEFVVRNDAAPPADRPNTVRFDRAVGLSQYTGWTGFRLTDLDDIRRGNCDSCYFAGGHELFFPS